jgi:hypothetical protein
MGLHEIKKLLHSKRLGLETKEAAHRMGKTFLSYPSDKGRITRMFREFKN